MNERILLNLEMIDYIENNYNVQVKDISIYYDKDNNYYSFDFFINHVYYSYYDDGIILVDFKDTRSPCIELNCNGIDRDEFFNVSLSFDVSILVLKEITCDLIKKAKELANTIRK